MAEVNANIGVHIDTSQALAQLKNLQREISLFHTSIAKSSATAAAAQRNLQTDFLNAINATGKFAAEFRTIKTASESFTTSLEKNKFSMREYFRYAGAATKSFGSLFKTEFDTINKVAEDRVKKLQTQYIKMGRDASGALKAISVTPLALDMNNLHTQTMIAAQRQQLFNELISKGTTNLINFGKNTQWAGRQLMVGFSVPLSIFGSQATKIFMDIEQQALRFKRVYGDLFTSETETASNLKAVRALAQEYTKYGIAVKDTMAMAADAAAAGFQGAKLQETVRQATKLSVLGEVDKQQAFQATISLQTAFQMSNEQLAESVNFLNAVENQSVTSLQDMTDAIPKVAPIIRGLGGDVKDMAVFLTAMKEGGVNAAEAANGLKSALASMINPTKAAKEMLAGVGISLEEITTRNKGNLMRTVLELGDALKGLEPLARTQVLEKIFGKYQFARVSALFDNISKSGSQAQRTMELMQMSSVDLAQIATKELGTIEENAAVKFKSAVESLKGSLAPVGETFLQIVTPIIEFITKVADKFSGLSDHTKKVIAVIITAIGGIAPIVLMLVGLFANFFGQMMKFFAMLRNGYLGLTGQSKVLGEQLQYQSAEMLDAAAVAHSLDQIHATLTQRFTVEADAVAALTRTYLAASAAAEKFALSNPGMLIPGRGGKTKKYADGVVTVPGSGTGDTVPAMLTPGEAVIPARMAKKYAALINAMVSGNIPGYNSGKKSITGGQSVLLSGLGFMGSGNNASGFGMDRGFFSQGQGFIQSMIASLTGGSHTLGKDSGAEPRRMTDNVMAEYGAEMKPYAEEIVDTLRKTATNMGGVEDSSLTLAQIVEKSKDDLTPIFDRMKKSGGKAALAAEAVEKHGFFPTVEEMGGKYGETRAPSAREGDTAGSVSMRRTSGGKSRFQPSVKRMWSFLTKGSDLEQLPVTYAHANEARLLGPELPFTGGAMKPGAVSTEEQNRLIGLMKQKGEIAKGSYSSTEIKSAVRLKKQGKSDATAYQQEVDKNTEDIYLTSRDRQSPHKQAGKDGADDANAYSDSKEKVMKKRRVASSKGGTVGPNGILPGTDIGSVVAGEQGFIGPMPGTFGQRMKSRMSSGVSGLKSRMAGMGAARGMLGVSGAVMGASMLPGAVGDFAQKLIPATMALQTMSMLQEPLKMMLSNPYTAAAAGIVGIVVATKLYNDAAEKGAQKLEDAANRQAEALIGSSDSAKNFADFIGTTTAAQREFSRNNKRIITADEAKTMTYSNYYKSDKGQQNAQVLARAGANGTGVNASAMDVARRAAIFNLSPADIAANIRAAAKQSGADELQIKAKVEQMLFNGKDLTKEPLTIDARMNFLNTQTKQNLESLKTNINKLGKIDLSKTRAIAPAATNYQDLRKAAGAQQSINDSYSGGIGGNIMGGLKQTFRFVKTSFSDSGIIRTQNVIKDFNKVQNEVAIATTKVKMAFSDETQYLGILNAQYADGLITQEKYNEEFANSAERIKQLTIAQQGLIEQLDKIDTSGKLGEAAIKDLVNNALAPLSKESPELFKEIKKDIDALPKDKRVEIAMGLADGSYTIPDILELKKYLDMVANNGLTYEAVIAIMYDEKASKVSIARMQIDALNAKLEAATDERVKGRIRGRIAQNQKIIDDARKVNQEPKDTTGTGKLDPNAGAAKTESSLLDNIIKQYRDVNKGNQTMTEGWKASAAALKNLFGKNSFSTSFTSGGLAAAIRGKGGTEPLINLVLGMSPTEWKDHAKELFNFDKNGNITSLKTLAKGLGGVFGKIFAGNLVEKNNQFVIGLQNQQKVITSLTANGMSYSDALKFVEENGQDAVNALADLDPASEAWAKMKKSIEDANAEALKSPEGRKAAVDKYVQKAMDNINMEADLLRAQAAAGLAQQEALVDAAQTEVQKAQDAIKPFQDLIDKNNHSIDLLQHRIDIEFDRPIAALNDQANELNNNLTIMDHQAQAINEQFDKQQDALNAVSKINQQIIAQNKQQISLADAITSGDMSAAAQAVQDIRAANAANAATSQQESLDAARKNAIDGLTVGGQTRKQIEEQLYQIGQQTYALEKQKKDLQDAIVKKQDENYNYQLSIYNIEQKQLIPAQENLDKAQKKLAADQKALETAISRLTYDGLTTGQLTLMQAEAKKAYDEYVKVKDAAAATAGSASSANTSIKGYASTLNALKDKTITITEIHNIVTNYIAGTGSPSGGGTPFGQNAFGGFIRAMAGGGSIGGNGILDTVPTMLTPGEFVVNRRAAKAFAPLLQSINSQAYPEMQGRMGSNSTISANGGGKFTNSTSNNSNNYQLSVHLNGSNMNPDQVAQTVIRKIKLMERNNIRRSSI